MIIEINRFLKNYRVCHQGDASLNGVVNSSLTACGELLTRDI